MSQIKGKVLKSTGSWYKVLLDNGDVIDCRVRGKLRLDGHKTTNPISVGDTVFIADQRDEEGKAIIQDYEARTNYIVRKSTNLSKQSHILAANVDRAYLLVTLKHPETYTVFIDRFLVAAESFRIPTTLIFNKIDLLQSEEEKKELEQLKSLYENIGYTCYTLSANDIEQVQFLKNEIKDKQVMIAGHSGTGKSTLVSALDSNLDLKVGEISAAHHQGQHTTTFAEMHPLESGGFIIDTPGIRAFGLTDLDKAVLSHYFPEMRERLNTCRFNNCQHLNEPGCSIKDAFASGEISESRFTSYLQMMTEEDENIHRRKKIP